MRFSSGFLASWLTTSSVALIVQRPLQSHCSTLDLSHIKNYAAVGDSYSAGIGAGAVLQGEGDYLCSRYDASFPSQINSNPRMGDARGRNFTHKACSGDTTDGVIKQLHSLNNASQDVITITAGGNDAFLSDILNECVFQWYSGANFINSRCPDQLKKAQDVIESENFHSKLDNLISIARKKLKPWGHIYYVGYAQFFGQEDEQCDGVTWAFFWNYGRREFLKNDKRSQMNDLVQEMNKVLISAVDRAGGNVTFIDWDQHVINQTGRFCEASFPETNGNRDGLLFYEWDTDDNKKPTDHQSIQASPSTMQVTPDLVMNGTWMGRINDLYRQAMNDKSTPEPCIRFTQLDQEPIDIQSVNATPDQIARGYSVNVAPDSSGRIFHPRPNGHALIADLVVDRIIADNARSRAAVPG